MVVEQGEPIAVPDFSDGFMDSDELADVANDLIERHLELGHLASYELAYLWKQRGGKERARPKYGHIQKAAGLVKHYSKCDAVVWIAADHVHEDRFTDYQLRALMYRLLSRLDEDEDDKGEVKLVVRGDDIQASPKELTHFGAWWPGAEDFENAVRQMELF